MDGENSNEPALLFPRRGVAIARRQHHDDISTLNGVKAIAQEEGGHRRIVLLNSMSPAPFGVACLHRCAPDAGSSQQDQALYIDASVPRIALGGCDIGGEINPVAERIAAPRHEAITANASRIRSGGRAVEGDDASAHQSLLGWPLQKLPQAAEPGTLERAHGQSTGT